MEIEIQQTVKPYLYLSFNYFILRQRRTLIFMQIQSRLRVTCVIEHSLNRKKDTKDEMKYGLQKIE